MKRILLFGLALGLYSQIQAQHDATGTADPDQVETTVIGTTYADLQSTSNPPNRIINHGAGDVSTVFLYNSSGAGANGSDFNQAFYTTARTGYNTNISGSFFDAGNEDLIQSIPMRYPTIAQAGDTLVVVSDMRNITTERSELYLSRKSVNGSDDWVSDTINTGAPFSLSVPMIASNGDSMVYIVAHSSAVSNNKGVGLTYILLKSSDYGRTWDSLKLNGDTGFYATLPLLSDSSTSVGPRWSQIAALTAKDSTVVLAYFGFHNDVLICVSQNYGITWDVDTVFDANIDPKYISNDTSASAMTINSYTRASDGSGDVLIDNNGVIHVVWGDMYIIDANPTNTQESAYQYAFGLTIADTTNGIMYWNTQTAGTPKKIAQAPNINKGDLDYGTSRPIYYASLASWPTLGINDNNTLFLSYAAINELDKDGSQRRRHVYAKKSWDNGANWGSTIDLTPHLGVFPGDVENIFTQMAEKVDDNLHITYMSDPVIGVSIDPSVDVALQNIVYLKMDTTLNSLLDSTTSIHAGVNVNGMEISPNPSYGGSTALKLDLVQGSNVEVKLYDITGQQIGNTINYAAKSGYNRIWLNTEEFEGGIYFVSMTTSEGETTTRKLIVR